MARIVHVYICPIDGYVLEIENKTMQYRCPACGHKMRYSTSKKKDD